MPLFETDPLGIVCFALGVFHTFLVQRFKRWAKHFSRGSFAEKALEMAGTIEIVIGTWALVYVLGLMLQRGLQPTSRWLASLDYKEPLFMFVIMVVAASRPILTTVHQIIHAAARFIPLPRRQAFYVSCLSAGPILGSFVTEPAAVTVTALVLRDALFEHKISKPLKYATLGTLFVNASVGGTLTPFGTPPVLMVAETWHWGFLDIMQIFGWKAVVAVLLNSFLVSWWFGKELRSLPFRIDKVPSAYGRAPFWVVAIHLATLCVVIATGKSVPLFFGAFLLFLGIVNVTEKHQDDLFLKESLLVTFFLCGLVVLGQAQQSWVIPLIMGLDSFYLFIGSLLLTGFTDNTTLTYLGSLVPEISASAKYALVAGAVAGGGLTVVANLPNVIGYSILNKKFDTVGISPVGLFLAALAPTLLAALCFWLLPGI